MQNDEPEATYPAHTVSDADSLIMIENGKRYRMLQVGETLEMGDQVYCYSGNGNERSWEYYDGGMFGSKILDPIEGRGLLPQGFYRRPIAD